MNPELYEMLHVLDTRITNLEQINKENQILMQSINRSLKLARYIQIFYLILIVGGTLGVYTIIKTFIGGAQNSLLQLQSILGDASSFLP
jgi:uncharacterized ion transporter superfamily protein YfcC